ncbi:alpha/beta-hydrolase family protein [Corynebacterium vitaeruminis]|uniref:alpha/beta-hydrolase family protein n=1 Tax=Corynebacterium vitaeruminis TaxID=38305 RepID=UPI00054CEE10|nr:alpha/beta-hydrolase family protein [Corynebacterium vitaeruminis]
MPFRPRMPNLSWRRAGVLGASIGLIATEVAPGFRLLRRGLLPRKLYAGFLGAELGTWVALTPSLLPRPWWSIALSVGAAQVLGHAGGAALGHATGRPRRVSAHPTALDLALSSITFTLSLRSYARQHQQAALVTGRQTGARAAMLGVGLGTVGYGGCLLGGEMVQFVFDGTVRLLRHRIPDWLAGMIAAAGIGWLAFVLSDKVLVTRVISTLTRRAQQLNLLVFQGTRQPWEPERSGSPWSFEPWTAVGSQGRAVLSGGPRARHIEKVTKRRKVHEPIRIYVGLVPGRGLEGAVEQVIQEMLRTGALHREVIVIHTSTGTGWVSDWHLDPVEFLTKGNCVNISMQYSYVPSPVAFVTERELPAQAASLLIEAVLDLVAVMPTRPRIYVAGESLGAYGTASAFGSLEELRMRVDGCVLSGAPYFTGLVRELSRRREPGSPERLPLVGGGQHVRFIAHPAHLERDYQGNPYPLEWEFPRVAVVQHASDPIVWWDPALFIRPPAWLREVGAAGTPAPGSMHCDVPFQMRWVPVVTGIQVALDMLIGTTPAGDHGHNYRQSMIQVWAAVLGVKVKPKRFRRIAKWIRKHSVKR